MKQTFGPLMAIGGAEDRTRNSVILRRFANLCGNGTARISVIPSASRIKHAGEQYRRVLQDLGANQVEVLRISERADTEDEGILHALKQSTGIFMTGGSQVRLARMIGGTPVGDAIAEMNREGVPVAGTSAGASVMSSVMVAGGRSGTTPRSSMARFSRGLGLIDSVIIDQHFAERDRVSRLVAMVGHNPGLLGIGIDEDTAALISPDRTIEVIGRGSVLIVDGSEMETDIEQVRPAAPPTIANAVIHFIGEGGRYSLDERVVVPQD